MQGVAPLFFWHQWVLLVSLIFSSPAGASPTLAYLSSGSYNVSIYENSPPRTYVTTPQLMGVPLDGLPPGSHVDFIIERGDSHGLFTTESQEVGGMAVLHIRTRTDLREVLNRERQARYALSVKAEVRSALSRGPYTVTTVFVDILDQNDNFPLFYSEFYDVEAPEDVALHSPLLSVAAEDADAGRNGAVYYALEDPYLDTFAVHPITGIVSVTRPLVGVKSTFKFKVTAFDRGLRLKNSQYVPFTNAVIEVKVLQVNKFPPDILIKKFPHVVEHAHAHIYAVLQVNDKDGAGIRDVDIIEGDHDRMFNIVGKNGEYNLTLLRLVDREMSLRGYNLTIRATDAGTPPKSSLAYVKVDIEDVNDHSPVFLQELYEVSVSEEAPPDTHVVQVSAMDLDDGGNGLVTFHIMAGNEDERFHINSKTGLVSTAKWLDAEATAYFTLTITAVDDGIRIRQRQSSARLVIRILDANDNAPQFVTPNTEVTVDENEPVGSYVTKVTASDVDSGENGFLSYDITNLDVVPFVIDLFDGTIRTSEILDFESQRRVYTIHVRASDWGHPFKRETETTVKVKVRDVNDNRPQFEQVDCIGQVPLDTSPGTRMFTYSAIDLDADSSVTYKMEGDVSPDCWSLDSSTGSLALTCDLRLFLTEDLFVLNVTASDGQHVSDIQVTQIKVGAHLPAKFTCQDTNILGHRDQMQRAAKEHNSIIETYALLPPRYGFNSHAPEFSSGIPETLQVKEDCDTESPLFKIVATDKDAGHNGRVVYAISGGNVDSTFQIHMHSGILSLRAPLDREHKSEYNLNITAYDLGIPHKSTSKAITIYVIDINDCSPEFERVSYSLYLPENTLNGTSVAQFRAHDRDDGINAVVWYEMVSKVDEFILDPNTGVLHVSNTLDREKREEYDLRVRAWDKSPIRPLFSLVRVTITILDINDCSPDFGASKIVQVTLEEDIPVGSVVATFRATDLDLDISGIVSYSISGGPFRIDPQTGVVRVASSLDFESRLGYNITIKAEDGGKPSLESFAYLIVTVKDVDENMGPPVFSRRVSRGSVLENQPLGSLVMTLEAQDVDGGVLKFAITGGDGKSYFIIDHKGEIRTVAALDTETSRGYWLTVTVWDDGTVPLTDTCHVYVEVLDVNDHYPQTEDPAYHPFISEDAESGTRVLTLRASDGDLTPSNISFEATKGDGIEIFHVDSISGVVTTKGLLDREKQASYELWVTVSDGQLSTITPIFITVSDINDNAPVFIESIYTVVVPAKERHSKRHSIARKLWEMDDWVGGEEWTMFFPHEFSSLDQQVFGVFARDDDIGPNGNIDYSVKLGKAKGRFKIHPKTGVIYSSKPLLAGQTFDFMVQARDGGHPSLSSSARVILRVVPLPLESPHPPVVQTPSPAQLMENDPPGHLISFILAHDEDNDTLWYSIVDGDDSGRFHIGVDSGLVMVARQVDREEQRHFRLVIEVTDGIHEAVTELIINVIDINDHRPVFSRRLYEAEVTESSQPGGAPIVILQCRDKDQHGQDSSLLYFTLHHYETGVSKGLFNINPNTGDIRVANPLNREIASSHLLTVSCRDRGGREKADYARVVITVTDDNDCLPIFLEDTFYAKVFNKKVFKVLEGSAVGTSVLQVTAVDRDKGLNGLLSYSISEGNVAGTFNIDKNLGIIRTARNILKAERSEYLLLVRATDHGHPSHEASAPVHLEVQSSSESLPLWKSSQKQVIEVSEWASVGSAIAQVSAISSSSLRYDIVEGNEGSAFLVSPSSGIISLALPLDYETTHWYNLTIKAETSMGRSQITWLGISVIDENDWYPEWDNTEYFGVVTETALKGAPVFMLHHQSSHQKQLIVTATDNDSSKNGLVIYSMVESYIEKYFKINVHTGAIYVAGNLEEFAGSHICFNVWACDGGTPNRESLFPASVNISVSRTVSAPFLFTSQVYNSTLFIPTVEDVKVICTYVSDSFNGSSKGIFEDKKEIKFSITDGNGSDHFYVNEKSGCIYVKNSIGLKNKYSLTVNASNGIYSSQAIVLISLTNAPSYFKFSQEKYWANVIENSTKELNIVGIGIQNLPLNKHIRFSILNPNEFFDIRPTSGILKTTGKPFDREEKDVYTLIVQAQDLDYSLEIGQVRVVIVVVDVNDNAPIFVGQPYIALVPTGKEKNLVITKVKAIDSDSGDFGIINYEFVRGNGELFGIEKETGDVFLKQELTTPDIVYSLTVAAYDGGKPPLDTQAHILIKVVSAEGPLFSTPLYEATVPEDAQVGSAIIRVEAATPTNAPLIYTIVSGSTLFSLDYSVGVIKLTALLDFEESSLHNLTVRTKDPETGLHADAQVSIQVIDVNDNPPQFKDQILRAEVAQPGHIITKVKAEDKDTGLGGLVQYSCMAECTNFSINLENGAITLDRPLDAESVQEHRLIIAARDSVFPFYSSTVTVLVKVLDFNDNAPVWEKELYTYHVSPEAEPGHIITVLSATDPDISENFLKYSIHAGNLFLQRRYKSEVTENSLPGEVVLTVTSEDHDTGIYGKIAYSIIHTYGVFKIDENGDIRTELPLDREVKAFYDLHICASDGGGKKDFATVRINVIDRNDNEPFFSLSEKQANIKVDTKPGTSILKVEATDIDEGLNSEIIYSLYEDSNSEAINLFTVDSSTGDIYLSDSVLGRENEVFQFFIRAEDQGIPKYHSHLPVSIFFLPLEEVVTKCPIKFFQFFMSESDPIGTVVTSLWNSGPVEVSYLLIQDDTKRLEDTNSVSTNYFSLSSSGFITLKKLLDHEKKRSHKLTVLNRTLSTPPAVDYITISIVVMDVNDCAPVFPESKYTVSVAENAEVGSIVAVLVASDDDDGSNRQLLYKIKEDASSEVKATFQIDPHLGFLSLVSNLDRERTNHYLFSVVATDGGSPSLSTEVEVEILILDYNDNFPIFDHGTYLTTVSEDAEIGTVITDLSLSDADESITPLDFFVLGGDPNKKFLIDSAGQIKVAKSLDRESQDEYILAVTATDGKFTANATVSVTILDANDNGPVCIHSRYHKLISESAIFGSHVVSVLAWDADEGLASRSRFSLNGECAHYFAIDEMSGQVFTAKMLDREDRESFSLTIVVEDWDHPEWQCEVLLDIDVGDINDNPPKFASEMYYFAIAEDAKLYSVVGKVEAHDIDTGTNKKIAYKLLDSANDHFDIYKNEGIITLSKSLDRETKDAYRIIVAAFDNGIPSLSSTSTVVITVTENSPIGMQVTHVMATSKDIGINAKINYSLDLDTEEKYLSIDPKTGIITVSSLLDYEKMPSIIATVIATDNGVPSLSAAALVNVTIADVNDNSPEFSLSSYHVSVKEDVAVGESILQVSASDLDSGVNSHILFSLLGNTDEGHYKLNPKTGAAKQLLKVGAKDGGSPANSVTVSVHITVLDVNDNAPVFSQTNYSAFVQENKQVGYSILTLRAEDADEPPNGEPFTWELIGEESAWESPPFTLEPLNQEAILRLATNKLNHKVQNEYRLKACVYDSGMSPLIGETNIMVTVVEESRYPPTVFPLYATITTFGKAFHGGLIGRITALDQDLYDELHYSISKYPKDSAVSKYFNIDKENGTLSAIVLLDSGIYRVNVSVTDGKYERAVQVTVDVKVITKQMIYSAIIIRIGPLLPEEFLSRYRKIFIRSLALHLNFAEEQIEVLSVQSALLHYKDALHFDKIKREIQSSLDILLVLRKKSGALYLRKHALKLIRKRKELLQEKLNLPLLVIMDSLCNGASNCSKNGKCVDVIDVHNEPSFPYSTQLSSYVVPHFSQKTGCVCQQGYGGSYCEKLVNTCIKRPCLEYEECHPSASSVLGFSCQCPEKYGGADCTTDLSNCHGASCYNPLRPLSFTGKSYAQYSISHPIDSTSIYLNLHIRTRHPVGTLIYASGDIDYSILEIADGYVQYRWECGAGEGLVRVSSIKVNDNMWHNISLSRDGTKAVLTVDDKASSGVSPGTNEVLNINSDFMCVGAQVFLQTSASASTYSRVSLGFTGCLDTVYVDGIELPVAMKSATHVDLITLKRLANVELHCPENLPVAGICASYPCFNGGMCTENKNKKSYICTCNDRYTGPQCQIDNAPCASNPCLNGGKCIIVGHSYECKCPPKLSGKRCEYGIHCNPNPCLNGGRCEEGHRGPVCRCQHFIGPRCENDIDECIQNPCQNGGTCLNLYGGFKCLCTVNTSGEYCTEVNVKSHASGFNITLEQLVCVLAVFLSCIVALLLLVAWQRKRWKQKRHLQNNRLKLTDNHLKNDLKSNDVQKRNSKICNVEADQQQQSTTLPRPGSFTPCSNETAFINTLKHFAELSAASVCHESLELENLSRQSHDYIQSLSRTGVTKSLGAAQIANNDCSATNQKPWDHHNNLNEPYFAISKDAVGSAKLEEHQESTLPFHSHIDEDSVCDWDKQDIRQSNALFTFVGCNTVFENNSTGTNSLNTIDNCEMNSQLDINSGDGEEGSPLLSITCDNTSSSEAVKTTLSTSPLLGSCDDNNHGLYDENLEEGCSFEEILLANNISVSEDVDFKKHEKARETITDFSEIKYNIIPSEDENVNNYTNKISNLQPQEGNYNSQLNKFGSPRCRRPFHRSDYGRISDLSFMSDIDENLMDSCSNAFEMENEEDRDNAVTTVSAIAPPEMYF